MIEYMIDSVKAYAPASASTVGEASGPPPVPLKRLEARICELAGHLTAATCQFLLLVADFDARRGWEPWEMPSCAAWLSWKCQVAPGTAREQVRTARALAALPVITAEFAAGRLSYAKVRALTRIATPDTEADLAQMATPMTAGQLERFARAHRRVTREQDRQARARRRLAWGWVDDHEWAFRGLLPAGQAAVVLQALRAARGDLEHPHDEDHEDVSAETRAELLSRRDKEAGINWDGPAPPPAGKEYAADLADALVEICAAYLGARAAAADNPDAYQVIIHAGADAITGGKPEPEPERAEPAARVSAETPAGPQGASPAGSAARPLPITHPAYLARCHIEDGPAISPQALKLIACNATLTAMVHDADGKVIAVGDRTRKPPAKLRRAVRERDRYRCRFPGCQSRRTDIHHVVYWANGGKTRLDNLICLCKRHHHLVHHKDLIIAAAAGGFTFYTKDGIPLPASPPLPAPSGDITTCHQAAISPATVIPPNSGERLDLHMAIWVAFTNARNKAERRQREQQAEAQAALLTGRLTSGRASGGRARISRPGVDDEVDAFGPGDVVLARVDDLRLASALAMPHGDDELARLDEQVHRPADRAAGHPWHRPVRERALPVDLEGAEDHRGEPAGTGDLERLRRVEDGRAWAERDRLRAGVVIVRVGIPRGNGICAPYSIRDLVPRRSMWGTRQQLAARRLRGSSRRTSA